MDVETDLQIRELHDLADIRALSALFDRVWGRDNEVGPAMPVELLVAMTHAGCQVTGAFSGEELIAGTAALVGLSGGTTILHSHITGVDAGAQNAGVGWELKQYQRDWALEHGIGEVRWTFDPLVRRNAVFNLVKLGARPVDYLEDCYGPMQDDRNRGLPTDRLLTSWKLTERRVESASQGRFAEPRLEAVRRVGARQILVDDDGNPRVAPADADHLLAQIPADIEAIRAADPARAARWSQALRETLGRAMRSGHRVTGITRDGWYVLARDRRVDELADSP